MKKLIVVGSVAVAAVAVFVAYAVSSVVAEIDALETAWDRWESQ